MENNTESIQTEIQQNDELKESIKKKRGRKKLSEMVQPTVDQNITYVIEEKSEILLKKRGRKPKGGKIINKIADNITKSIQISNVILHLKCSLSDLNNYNLQMNQQITQPEKYNPSIPPNIMTYNKPQSFANYENIQEPAQKFAYNELNASSIIELVDSNIVPDVDVDTDNLNIKDINLKLKKLKVNIYKNALSDKKSACFWCTCDYDNEMCYIPKANTDTTIFGYGSFCRPECAVAYLMNEHIDDSTKFERYHLLNQIYSKIYNYNKNIKPAPNPYYLLDKFYGNLTIQEYRKLLKSSHLLLVIDKPLTRILPELHEENDEFILNVFETTKNKPVNTSGIYKVKKQSEKLQGPTKNSIMRNNFNIN